MLVQVPLGVKRPLLTGPEGAVLRWGLVSDMWHLPGVLPPSLLLVKMASRILLFGRGAHSFKGVVRRWPSMLRLVVVTRRPRRGQQGGEWGAGDGGVSLDTTCSKGELHQTFTERANMSLLQILQPIILVHLPCPADPLHCGAALGAHLGVGHTGDIEGGAH